MNGTNDDQPKCDICISATGSDSGKGTVDSPVRSLAAARNLLRARLTSNPGRDYTVLLREGTYELAEPLVLGPADAAEGDHTVTYASWPGEEAILSGAAPLASWKRLNASEASALGVGILEGRLWRAEIPRGFAPRSLYAGTTRLERASSETVEPLAFTDEALRWRDGLSAPVPRSRDGVPCDLLVLPESVIGSWGEISQVELVVVPERTWTMQILGVAEVDRERGFIRTARPHTYPMQPTTAAKGPIPKARVHAENSASFLSRPLQWAVDAAAGYLYYVAGDDESGAEPVGIVAPLLTELIRVEGEVDYDGPEDRPVRGIRIESITFRHTDRFPWFGRSGMGVQHDWEAFDKPTAAVRLRAASDCCVRDCTFEALSGAAVRLDLTATGNAVDGNLIQHIGGCGVLLCGYGPGTKDANRDNHVSNNRIFYVGEITTHAPAIFAWQSGGNRIAGNTIAHTPYTAIIVSGRIQWDRTGEGECSGTIRWKEVDAVLGPDYQKPLWHDAWLPDWERREPLYHGRANRVEYNDITDVMEVMGDGNGVYVSGCGGGNVVRYNRIHDCPSDLMYEAIRCDDDQHGVTIHGNLIYRLGGAAIGIASKGINHITNNIVAAPLSPSTHRAMISLECGPLYGVKIQRNIIYATRSGQALYYQGPRLHGEGPLPLLRDTMADWNLYWCEEDPDRCRDHLEGERVFGIELHSRAVDPLFVDLDGGDFRLDPRSEALRLGFEPLPLSAMGVSKEGRS